MKLIANTSAIAAVALLVAVTGCAMETNSDTRADAADAQSRGPDMVSSARIDAADGLAEGSKEMTNMERDTANEAADSAMALAVAESEAAHEVATERCESQSGDARAQCIGNADLELKAAKDRAEATKLAAYPKS